MTAPLTIKGIREGLLITVGGGEWEAARAALLQSIDVQGAFFNGAKVALQLGVDLRYVIGGLVGERQSQPQIRRGLPGLGRVG